MNPWNAGSADIVVKLNGWKQKDESGEAAGEVIYESMEVDRLSRPAND